MIRSVLASVLVALLAVGTSSGGPYVTEASGVSGTTSGRALERLVACAERRRRHSLERRRRGALERRRRGILGTRRAYAERRRRVRGTTSRHRFSNPSASARRGIDIDCCARCRCSRHLGANVVLTYSTDDRHGSASPLNLGPGRYDLARVPWSWSTRPDQSPDIALRRRSSTYRLTSFFVRERRVHRMPSRRRSDLATPAAAGLTGAGVKIAVTIRRGCDSSRSSIGTKVFETWLVGAGRRQRLRPPRVGGGVSNTKSCRQRNVVA